LQRLAAPLYPARAVVAADAPSLAGRILNSRIAVMSPAAILDAPQREHDVDRAGRLAPFWRRAFAGLTWKAVAIIAALLLARMLSTSAESLLSSGSHAELATRFLENVTALPQLLLMAGAMLVVIVVTSNLGPQRGRARIAALAGAVVAGTGLGIAARMSLGDWFDSPHWGQMRGFLAYVGPRYLLIGSLFTVVAELYRRERFNITLARQAEFDSVALERELAAAQLQAMQAQIEPHFLFNTLANVRRLYDEDRVAGRRMLDMLMRYIEVALRGMRRGASTLAREAELIEAYLHIQRVRMGPRLAFSVDIPQPLRDVAVPPMMLLTLVENAVKHGLTPSPDGGRIRVTARADAARLVLTVADTGVGFGSGSGTGVGLANVSARLASQFGERAKLVLENNELGGATASIVLPFARTREAA
jgi:signal transduction histidine kinase